MTTTLSRCVYLYLPPEGTQPQFHIGQWVVDEGVTDDGTPYRDTGIICGVSWGRCDPLIPNAPDDWVYVIHYVHPRQFRDEAREECLRSIEPPGGER